MIGESGGREQGRVLSSSARKALKMSVVHVVAFVLCWTPYHVLGRRQGSAWEDKRRDVRERTSRGNLK